MTLFGFAMDKADFVAILVFAAYAVTALGLSGLAGAVLLNLRHWARRAREEEARK